MAEHLLPAAGVAFVCLLVPLGELCATGSRFFPSPCLGEDEGEGPLTAPCAIQDSASSPKGVRGDLRRIRDRVDRAKKGNSHNLL